MKTNNEKIIRLLGLKKSGEKGWYSGDCVYCGKSGKMGVVFNDTVSSFHCFSAHCGEHGTLYKLLKYIGRLDLTSVSAKKDIDIGEKLKPLGQVEQIKTETEEKKLPMGFKRISDNAYLEDRGFNVAQYDIFKPGVTDLHPALKNNYIVFPIFENKQVKGYVARSILSSAQIDYVNAINKKKGIDRVHLRYVNSKNTDFSKLLFGIDEIQDTVRTVILVEGIFDKFNIDNLLDLYIDKDIKCIATFGKKISDVQIEKLRGKEGIRNIILLYDPDAIAESKKYSLKLMECFNVEVGALIDSDPGDLKMKELLEVLDNLQDPLDFYTTQLDKKELKQIKNG